MGIQSDSFDGDGAIETEYSIDVLLFDELD